MKPLAQLLVHNQNHDAGPVSPPAVGRPRRTWRARLRDRLTEPSYRDWTGTS
jgi:hypothetical protein